MGVVRGGFWCTAHDGSHEEHSGCEIPGTPASHLASSFQATLRNMPAFKISQLANDGAVGRQLGGHRRRHDERRTDCIAKMRKRDD